MSTRAYKLIEIKTEKNSIFNLSRVGEQLAEVLSNAGFYENENGDIYNVKIDLLELELKNCKDLGDDEYAREGLLNDIKQAKKDDEEYLQYYYF